MNEQINLFQSLMEETEKEIAEVEEKAKTEGKDDTLSRMVPCVKCGVKPVIGITKPMPTLNGFDRSHTARCPVCGYMCASFYDIADHWNDMQICRVRWGKV